MERVPASGKLLAEQMDIEFIPTLEGEKVDERLASNLLRLDAVQFSAVPYKMEEDTLVVAIADPRRMPDIEAIVSRPIRFVASPESEVLKRIDRLYANDQGRLGETLLQNRRLKREQLRRALEEQIKLGSVKPLGEILVDLGYVTQAEVDGGDLYFSCTLPNLIVGTVGGGTRLPTAQECLAIMECVGTGKAARLAEIAAAVALAGEISIMGALCAGEFAQAHASLGRGATP